LVAVASNFADPLVRLKQDFEAREPFELRMSVGSTGKLFAQIASGAPYDVLLAADQERPRRLEQDGLVRERFSYALGRLVLWSARAGETGVRTDAPALRLALQLPPGARLAMANPQLAPYGLASQQVLTALGVWDDLQGAIVLGENIGQAHTLVATGNALLGFSARSYLQSAQQTAAHSIAWRLEVPQELHQSIVQDAVWLKRGADNLAAQAFVRYLQSDRAARIIAAAGYELPGASATN